ncbi:cell division protein PerM, partial [Streptomyces sp. CO7]
MSTLMAGLTAAGTGLVVLAVPVLFLWMTSPYPGSGPGNALHTTAALWLSAHGVDLIRADTLSGVPAPMGIGPLLLTALPVWLLHRAGRSVVEGGDGTDEDAPPPPGVAWAGVTAGYVAAGLLAALYAMGGGYRPGWGWTTFWLPALAAGVSLCGMWAGSDHLRRAVDRTGGRLPDLLLGRADRGRRLGAVFRAAGEGAVALVCGGALLAAIALVLHAGDAGAAFGRLAGGWVSGVTLLLLCLALLPNAAVWAAAYALGAGFLLGPAMVAPLGAGGTVPRLPVFPWLAAVPTGTPQREAAGPAGGAGADVTAGADAVQGVGTVDGM